MKRILCLGMLLCLLTACAGPVEMTSQEPDTAASYGTENETDVPIESEAESENSSSPKVYPGKEPPGGKYVKGGFCHVFWYS